MNLRIYEKDIEKTLQENIIGKRYKDILEVKNGVVSILKNELIALKVVKVLSLNEDERDEVICDNNLIGTLLVDDGYTENQYDFELYYIIDNQENYYITEVITLGEVI